MTGISLPRRPKARSREWQCHGDDRADACEVLQESKCPSFLPRLSQHICYWRKPKNSSASSLRAAEVKVPQAPGKQASHSAMTCALLFK